MKKLMAILCASAVTLCGSSLAACSLSDDKAAIVCTVFAEYDWVCAVLGENSEYEVKLLQDSGTDMHSYSPSVSDIAAIAGCELFIYVGGESDSSWVDSALSSTYSEERRTISLIEIIGDRALDEEITEGMQEDDDHDHDHDHDDDDDAETDEHVWLSLINAQIAVQKIAEVLGEMDEENAEYYAANAESYCEQLAELDESYSDMVASAQYDTVVFGDRFPFLYLMKDYGINYYAAFSGCSAETGASFETIYFLATKVDELGLPAILTIEGSSVSIAETVRDNTTSKNQLILTLDSLQSVTKKDIAGGASYLSAMQKNLEVLAQALGAQV